GGGAVGRIRRADSEAERFELLARVELPGSEAGLVQQAPEVVARIGEVRLRSVRDAARIDAAEDDGEAGPEHIRNGARRCHAFGAVAFHPRHDFLTTIAAGRRWRVP